MKCALCEKDGNHGIGGLVFCALCDGKIQNEITALREKGKQVSVSRIVARWLETERKQYSVPPDLVLLAEAEAVRRRKESGENVNWSDVIREKLKQGFKS